MLKCLLLVGWTMGIAGAVIALPLENPLGAWMVFIGAIIAFPSIFDSFEMGRKREILAKKKIIIGR